MLNASDWSAETAEKLKLLWADPVIKEVYSMRDSIYQLNDSMAQYVVHLLELVLISGQFL
jgi:hypothetical protein